MCHRLSKRTIYGIYNLYLNYYLFEKLPNGSSNVLWRFQKKFLQSKIFLLAWIYFETMSLPQSPFDSFTKLIKRWVNFEERNWNRRYFGQTSSYFLTYIVKIDLVFGPFFNIVISSKDWPRRLMFATLKRIWPRCKVSRRRSFLNLLGLLGPIYFFDMIFYIFLQSHSIHGMNDEGTGNKPYKEMGTLTYEEKKFLLAVERGDVASVRR